MISFSDSLRITRYVFTRDAICVIVFLTFAIWILEVFSYERPHSYADRPVHSHHRRSDMEQPVTRQGAEETSQVDQLHELSTIQHEPETINLGETFVWEPE
jgi:hypothetical protein